MIYIKSALGGMAVFAVAAMVYLVILIRRATAAYPGHEIGIDLLAVLSNPTFLILGAIAFLVGFLLTFLIAR